MVANSSFCRIVTTANLLAISVGVYFYLYSAFSHAGVHPSTSNPDVLAGAARRDLTGAHNVLKRPMDQISYSWFANQASETGVHLVRDTSTRWLMGECIGFGTFRIGLPGIASLALQLNPMVESMPSIRQVGDVGKTPLLPFSGMAITNIIWFTYGSLADMPSVWLQSTSGVILSLYYCKVFCSFCPKDADWLPSTPRIHWLSILATGVFCACAAIVLPMTRALQCLGILGNVAALILFGSPLAAVRTVLKEQSTRSMAFGFTCCVALTCGLWTYQGYFILNDPFIYASYVLGLVLASIQLALFARFDGVSSFACIQPQLALKAKEIKSARPWLPLKAEELRELAMPS